MTTQLPSWIDSNSIFNVMSAQQGVPAGSPAWLEAGIAPFSEQTGPHPSYGWRFHHLDGDDRKRAVLARYGAHGIFFEGAPYRVFGGTGSGRPDDWNANGHGREGIDMPGGSVAWMSEHGVTQVSGPDVQHAWFTPLLAVIDAPPIMVDTQFGKIPSNVVAHILFTYHLRALFGQIRVPGQGDGHDCYDWGYADRGNALLLAAMLEAHKRHAIEIGDAKTAGRFLTGPFFRVYETGPGQEWFFKGQPPVGEPFRGGIYNGLSWILPVISDAQRYKHFPERARLRDIRNRQSQWLLDLEKWTRAKGLPPGAGFQGEAFRLPPDLESPPPTIDGLILDVEGLESDGGTLALRRAWGFKACATALSVLGAENAPELVDAENVIRTEHAGDPEMKKWLVRPDGSYAVP